MDQPKTVSSKRSVTVTINKTLIITTLVVLAALGVGFIAGAHHERRSGRPYATQSFRAAGPGFGAGVRSFHARGAANGSVGAITAVSSTSITVSDRFSSTSKTYTIDDNTRAYKDGAPVAIKDLKTGDEVNVQTASSTSTTATLIMLDSGPTTTGPEAGTSSSPN